MVPNPNILQCKIRIRHSEIAHFPSLQQIGPNNKCKVKKPMVEEGRLRFYMKYEDDVLHIFKLVLWSLINRIEYRDERRAWEFIRNHENLKSPAHVALLSEPKITFRS